MKCHILQTKGATTAARKKLLYFYKKNTEIVSSELMKNLTPIIVSINAVQIVTNAFASLLDGVNYKKKDQSDIKWMS